MQETNHLPKNLEQVLQNLEENFWMLMNNPLCYCDIIYRFFDKN